MGPELKKFEEVFAEYNNTNFALGVANGTDAIEIALRAIGSGPNDEIITVANAGGYASTAITNSGSKPVYVDIEKDTLNMSPESLQAALNVNTKAIIVTHLFGKMADIENIITFANQAGVPVIEDCAQAHGAVKNGRHAGAWGTMGCFSFYPTKNLGCLGDGGAITTNDAVLARKIERIRQYGWESKYRMSDTLGINSRLDEIQAAILSELLPYLDEANEKRRIIVDTYRKGLAVIKDLVPPSRGIAPNQEDYVAHLCVIRSQNREKYCNYLNLHEISTEIHYPILDYHQVALFPNKTTPNILKHTELSANEVFTIPCFPEMTEKECQYVIEVMKECSAKG
jgi:dTDP-4-amino-4,6-dideoxygalactose transaminase